MTSKPLIGYIRVSTQRQGQSGLGLDAQIAAIEAYRAREDTILLQTYREVETGKHNAREQLKQAMAHAKRVGARLVIAKLDRLSRNCEFVCSLLNADVDFVACDNASANRLTIQILAAVAEEEARAISQRTTAALGAAKRRGTLLGSARPGHWDGREDRRLAGSAKGSPRGGKANAEQWEKDTAPIYELVRPMAVSMRSEGLSYAAIAEGLNAQGLTTYRGKPWTAMQVYRILP